MGSMGKSDNRAEDMQPPATVETDSMVEGLCLSSFAAVSKPVPGKSATAGWVSCWRPFTPILFTSGIATGNAQGALRRRLWLRLAHPRLSWRISTDEPTPSPAAAVVFGRSHGPNGTTDFRICCGRTRPLSG